MKLARGIVSILMFMLLFSFMSLPVFAMQTQSNGRTGVQEQSSVGSGNKMCQELWKQAVRKQRLFHLRDSTSQDNSLLKAVRFPLPEVSER